MKQRRTDLAMEGRELWQEGAGQATRLPGVEAHDGEREGLPVTTIRVLDREGEQALGKPVGCYSVTAPLLVQSVRRARA